jgi:hypothetical protein
LIFFTLFFFILLSFFIFFFLSLCGSAPGRARATPHLGRGHCPA